MGDWGVGSGSVGVTSFPKIYGLCSVKHQKVEKWSYYASCGWILWLGWVCVGDGGVGSGSLDSGCHQLSENIWFVWFRVGLDIGLGGAIRWVMGGSRGLV